ncbi:MAG: CPBP family intramembrane metalloprotease [Clostridia bacterium]|nr:CPBP family intramembrane metalloprotease [Clostridia bacterium]
MAQKDFIPESEGSGTTQNSMLGAATAGGTFSLLVLLYMVIILIASFIIAAAGLDSSSDAYKYINYLLSPIAIVITIFIIFRLRRQDGKVVFHAACHPKYYVIGLLMIFGLMFSVSYSNSASIEFFKLFGYVEPESSVPTLTGWNLLPAIIVVALIPAVCEECVFRGIIYANAEGGAGSVASIFLCGLLFSLYHGSPAQTVYQFICGCCFAFLVMRSGSILPSITIHFLNNALILIFEAADLFDETGYLALSSGASTALIIVSALCFVGAIVWLILDKKPVKKKKQGETGKFFIWAAFGIVVMVVIWIVNLVA